MKKALPALGLSVVFAAVGCGGSDDDDSSTGSKSQATQAAVTFISPKDGSTVGEGAVTAEVRLSDFKLAPNAVGKAPKAGEGHLHFKMDGGKFDKPKYSGANGRLAVQLGVDGKYSPSVAPTITYRNLPPGKHELEVYLARNNHSDTGVEAKTEFTVGGGPSASGGGTIAVSMKNIQFAPKTIDAKVGETVKWTNDDAVDHNVTATSGGSFKSRAFGKGKTFSYKLDKPGTISYTCTLHPGMDGKIVVKQ